MNLTHFHHTCMSGGKIYNSSRILHALLRRKAVPKTGGYLFKKFLIKTTEYGWVGAVGHCPNPLKTLNTPPGRKCAIQGCTAQYTYKCIFCRILYVFVQLYSTGTTCMVEFTGYTLQVYNNCAHHARMKRTVQC